MNVVLLFLGCLIKRGRKSWAFNKLIQLLCFLKTFNVNSKFKNVIYEILYKISPVVGLMNLSLSGKLYKIPYFISKKKQR